MHTETFAYEYGEQEKVATGQGKHAIKLPKNRTYSGALRIGVDVIPHLGT